MDDATPPWRALDRRERERFTPAREVAPAAEPRTVKAPAVFAELATGAQKLEANARNIREAALASEDAEGGWLWTVLIEENGEKSLDLLNAAARARQQIRVEQAAAEGEARELQKQLSEARARIAGYERQLAEIDERIVRPMCARLGQGDTRVIKTGLVRVAIFKSPARVEIADDDVVALLPDDCRRVTYAADKKAIKAHLEAGERFPGIELRHDTRVDWR